jgi:hypothetical protein
LFNVSSVLLVAVLLLMFIITLYAVERTNAHRTDKVESNS